MTAVIRFAEAVLHAEIIMRSSMRRLYMDRGKGRLVMSG